MDSRVRHAVTFIGEHLQSRISVDALAGNAGLSVSQFTRLFRRDLGTTPSVFVNRLRLERAALLLERTNLSVMEVMGQVGLTDPSHFARDFRRSYGFSPRTFRQHLRSSTRPHWQPLPSPRHRSSPHNSQEEQSTMTKSQTQNGEAAARSAERTAERPAQAVAEAERRSGRYDRRRFTRTDRRRTSGI